MSLVIKHADGKITVPSKDFVGKEEELAIKLGITDYSIVSAASVNDGQLKEGRKAQIYVELDVLYKKIVRAQVEPGEKEPGVTYYDYYVGKVKKLRDELKN